MTTIKLKPLMTLSIATVIHWTKKQQLNARRRRLYAQEQYFRDQVRNGQAGLSVTHKEIALTESDIRNLR
jgi:hypothetical protein